MRSKLLQQLGAGLGLEDANVVVAPAEPVAHNSDTENTIPAAGTDAAVNAVNTGAATVPGEAATAAAVVDGTPGVANATGDGSVSAPAAPAEAAAVTAPAEPVAAVAPAVVDTTAAPAAAVATVADAAGTTAVAPAAAPPVPATGSSPVVQGEGAAKWLIEGGADSMEDGLIETQATATDVANTEEAVEELEEVKAGLESIVSELEIAVRDGGLNAQAAQFLQLGVEAYTVRLGMETRMIPSLESFGGTTEKLVATKISMESIKETIRNIWEAILRTIRRIRAMLKNFFIRVFSAAPKVRARAEQIKKAAQAATGQAASANINAGGAGSALALGSGFPTNLGETLMTVDRLATDVFTTFHSNMVSACNDFATRLSGAGTDEEKLGALVLNFKPVLPNSLGGQGEDQFTHLSADLPGHKRLAVTLNTGAAKVFSAQMVPSGGNAPKVGEVKTQTPADVVKACDAIIAICNAVEGYQKNWQQAEGAVDNLTRAGDAFAKKVASAGPSTMPVVAGQGGAQPNNAANAKKVTNMVATLTQSVDAAQSKLAGYLMGVCKAALTVGELSVKEYNKGAAAPNTPRLGGAAATA